MQHLPRACAPLLLTAALLCISLSPLVSAHDSHDHAAHHHPHSLHDHAHTHVHDGHDHGDHGHDHGNGHTHGHGNGHDEVNSGSAATCSASSATCRARQAQASLTQRSVLLLSGAPIWAAALLSSALTGAASLFAVVLLPLRGPVLKAMLPFAAGALLADCALHLLPLLYATSDSHADHAHATLRGGVGALLAGIAAFFVLDALSRRLSGGACGHAHGKGQGHARGERAARMNLAADAVHNLCDGLSIGAAYLASRRAGVATTLAVLLHELPQEVGDFAVLLRAGWSWRRALLANVACAGTAVLGTAAALAVDQVASQAAREAILPFAAGGLLYLALTAILPDVLEDVEEGVPKKGSKGETVPVGFLAFVARVSVAVAAAALGVATVAAIERLHDH